jgi:hypothetical protein
LYRNFFEGFELHRSDCALGARRFDPGIGKRARAAAARNNAPICSPRRFVFPTNDFLR